MTTNLQQYLRLGRSDAARRERYRALFKAHLDAQLVDQIRQVTGNHTLGNARFQAEIRTWAAGKTRDTG